ncbi:dienelactone hydrolase family protein [Niastella populi]|uniref:Phospholipase n=1 Tax=Niastella populi TaxID=550983 RepID=A0A1V9GAA8_9BACT|nr:dienelactone hydrolase family protein [Niastella populi]OQP67553.1 phospholipase [Niastella populi]
MQKILTLLILISAMNKLMAQDNNLYEKKEFIKGADTLRYRMLHPANYQANKKYPLIVFLHGSGERGSDNERQLIHGGKLFADSARRQQFPAFVIYPQCPATDFWSRIKREPNKVDSLGKFSFPSEEPIGPALGMVSQLLDSLAAGGTVNTKKIYLGGLSMGGMGTFELLWRKPNFFAAAFPICGGGDPQKVTVYAKKFPIWIFHGDKDQAVPVGNSRLMYNVLKAAGARVKYTEYPGVGHNSWDNAFLEPQLLPWLFKQKR